MGGRSSTASTTQTVQDIDTTSVGLQDSAGSIGAGGDVEFTQNITDSGAIQGAIDIGQRSFDFAGEFGGEAFDFARDIAAQAGETSQEAIETSRQAIATVATGGATDLAGINAKTIAFIVAGLAAIFILPRLIKGRA